MITLILKKNDIYTKFFICSKVSYLENHVEFEFDNFEVITLD